MGRKRNGFTFIEIMVAMVVLAIGLMGMAAMTMLVIRGNRSASALSTATNLCQVKMEALKDVPWEDLGTKTTADTTADQRGFGLEEGGMVQEGGFNRQDGLNGEGLTYAEVETELSPQYSDATELEEAVRARGPFGFAHTFVVCKGTDYAEDPPKGSGEHAYAKNEGTFAANPGANIIEKNCLVVPTDADTRSQWLTCNEEDITTTKGVDNQEKKIKILCTWRDSAGSCHHVHLDTTVVQLSST